MLRSEFEFDFLLITLHRTSSLQLLSFALIDIPKQALLFVETSNTNYLNST